MIERAIQLSSSELIQDQTEGYLMAFFRTASAKKVIDANGAKKLLEIVSLKSTGAPACLAVVVASNAAFAGMLDQFW